MNASQWRASSNRVIAVALDPDLIGSIARNIGAGATLIFGGSFGIKFVWDYLKRQSDEKPKYEQMKAERDAADLRSAELWKRNQMLEGLIAEKDKEHANERREWIEKVDALTASLEEAKDQIRALQRQMKDMQDGK